MNFMDAVRARQLMGCHACVGLDVVWDKIPEHLKKSGGSRAEIIFKFNKAIIDKTKDYVCAYKLNVAFYSTVYGDLQAFCNTVSYIHATAPGIPVIVDAKRADIGKTNRMYVAEVFGNFKGDAVTVNPYFGQEGLQPFFEDPDKGVIVLCRTSNPGAAEFQNLRVLVPQYDDAVALGLNPDESIAPLYEVVALHVANHWNKNGNCALVVGATAPTELKRVRQIVGDMQLLIPGIGTQGGDLKATVEAGVDSTGSGMMINSSSGIIFASGFEDFADVASSKARELNDAIKALIATRI